ncbi:MAG: PDZ domain-containing protein [Pirellulales bacterium]|nr:PDZ domain-containing protein [Pirellulales bacterium]
MQLPICNLLVLILLLSPVLRADDLADLEQKAVSTAIERVAPSVVRIETVGGLETVEGVVFGIGPTTGWIVDPQGYIVSSAFNFSNQPSSILVRLPDGTRKPAELVAADHSRMIVLLKIESNEPLPVCEIAPEKELRVGQTAIALGRTFEGSQPNVSQGLLSALGRVWGKALQFDASASPNNYGGPLVDLRGRVLGLIVPLSPDSAQEVAGVEWYDSGIGFAISAEHLLKVLPRLKKGEDLRPGVAGFTMKNPNLYVGEAVLGSCRAKSPAAEAGLKPDDKIVEIDGRKITRAAEVKEEIFRRYAGDKLKIAVERGKENPRKLLRELTLVEKLANYRHPFLGILPMRDSGEKGVKVRYVYPQSPAQKAGLAAGDVVLSLAGKPTADRDSLLAILDELDPGRNAEIEFLRGDASKKAQIVLAALPDALPPADLPAAHGKTQTINGKPPQNGAVEIKIAEFPNEVYAYVPAGYDPAIAYGLLVWLHGMGGYQWEEVLAQWKPICDRHDLILLAPRSANPVWMPGEVEFIGKLVGRVRADYRVDPLRIVSFGEDLSGSLAGLAAIRHFDDFRAWAAVDATLIAPLPEVDPAHRFAVYMAYSKKSRQSAAVEASLEKIRAKDIPLTVKSLGDRPRPLTAAELEELARWIDMLDRM